ncbi:MAG: gliding motility-associated C-terminal domain-containing protein [Ferruginibacter sp.]|nr:gliding motility-associated C-terminal domain-containing protein [Ferruginibacter sp.]
MNKNCYGKLPAFLLVILFTLTSVITNAQQGFYNTTNWRFSNPKQFGFTLIDLDFFDDNKGIAVGANGGIAYTNDGGVKWSYGAFTYFSPAGIITSTTFQDVQFITATLAYAVGTNGCMAKTTDGGATWSFVRTPLYENAKNVNTVWFLDANKGYIGGQHNNTPDLAPKLYVTNNGGATWDSIAAPIGGKTRVGYANNVNLPPLVWDITAKGKEIYRIIFVNANLGYISGSGLGTSEPIPNVASTGTCLPTGATITTGTHHASLLWKFSNGTLTDYSISKERLGYNGVYTNLPPACNYRIASNTVHTASFKAMNIVNDTTVLLVASNNNIVIKVSTGPNSFTPNIGVSGVTEIGKYQLLNAPFPPTNNSPTQSPPIPASGSVFSFLNPMNIVKATNGKLFMPVNSVLPQFGPTNQMMTTVDTGKTWVSERFLPTGQNYSEFGGQAVDILPSGKMVFGGANGVTSEILPGGSPTSTYIQFGVGSWSKMDFADCNNIIAAGNGFITRTNDGGKTWNEIVRADFNSLGIQINSVAYVPNNPAKAYFATSIGTIYKSDNINAASPVLTPVSPNPTEQAIDVATIGNDSVWVCGQSGFSVAAANRSPKVFRSINGGTTWTTFNGFYTGTTSQTFKNIEFPTRLVGYVSGSRDTVWKTTDGGVTWNKLPLPTPGVTPQISYSDMFALDANTVFLVGQGFPRKAVFKTTDGGATWQDITSNILSIMPVSNLNSVVFHDANNGYVGANGAILVTNNGGATWRLDVQPSGQNNVTMGFSPKTVPASIPFANRKLMTTGLFGNHILEYGNPANVDVNAAEAITASCVVGAKGSVVVTATGGIAPYTYSINGGTPQASNTFSNLNSGTYTITIKDAFCGTLTKTVTVGTKPAPSIFAGNDKTIVDGDEIVLDGTGTATSTSIVWSPNTSIITGANTYTPTVKPRTTTNYLLTVTDANGCIATDNSIITVIPYCLKVQNAFSPNADGINDRWQVTNGAPCFNKIIAAVYNRYGNLVYKNDNYQNNWDGTYEGKPLPDGTYYYVVTYNLINGRGQVLKGDVTILR